MTKEKRRIRSFILVLGVQSVMAIVAILIIVFGNVELAVGGFSILGALIAGAAAGIAMYGAIFFGFRLKCFSRLKADISKNVNAEKVSFSWLQIITLAIFAGIAEELLFRGAIQTWVANHTNIYLGVLIASVLFGLVHFSSITYFLLSVVIGLAMGTAYHLSQSIEFVIVWHIVADIVGLSIFVKYPELLSKDAKTT